MTRQQPEKIADAKTRDEGDPSSIAMRVERITDIVQLRGVFERIPSQLEEVLIPEFLPIQAKGQMIGNSELGVTLLFGFIARSQDSGGPDSQSRQGKRKSSSAVDENADVRVVVEAGYIARYVLSAGPKPSDAEIQKFAEINGRLNLTPYWREFLDSSLRRAGLPPVLAPVVKSQKQPAAGSQSPDEGHKK